MDHSRDVPGTVRAVGIAMSSRRAGARRIQSAMTAAARGAMAEGITDPAIIRARMLAARDVAKAAGRAADV